MGKRGGRAMFEQLEGKPAGGKLSKSDTGVVFGLLIAIFVWAFIPHFLSKAVAAVVFLGGVIYLIFKSEFTGEWDTPKQIGISFGASLIVAIFTLPQLSEEWALEHRVNIQPPVK